MSTEFKKAQGELTDAFTGEVFKARARNHYEANDGKPVAPHVDLPRPTVRQRVENLIRRGVDPLQMYVGREGIDMDIPDDPEAPLTASEQNYIDIVAEDLAERAPLPDEGLPRPPEASSPPVPPSPPAAPGGGPAGSPSPAPAGGTVPSR